MEENEGKENKEERKKDEDNKDEKKNKQLNFFKFFTKGKNETKTSALSQNILNGTTGILLVNGLYTFILSTKYLSIEYEDNKELEEDMKNIYNKNKIIYPFKDEKLLFSNTIQTDRQKSVKHLEKFKTSYPKEFINSSRNISKKKNLEIKEKLNHNILDKNKKYIYYKCIN